ncbi:MAG TPA: hypothetical protein ENJ54_01010 [Chloroflexi bacterium]|nr:hypothetical protein [Chloroflexota bacterium]
MTTMAYADDGNGALGGCVMILLAPIVLGLIGLALVVGGQIATSQHAVERHGSEAIAIRQCVQNGSSIRRFWRLRNGRYAVMCKLPDGKWGIEIFERLRQKWQEVTAFVPRDGSAEAVQRYLWQRGTPTKPFLP